MTSPLITARLERPFIQYDLDTKTSEIINLFPQGSSVNMISFNFSYINLANFLRSNINTYEKEILLLRKIMDVAGTPQKPKPITAGQVILCKNRRTCHKVVAIFEYEEAFPVSL